MLELSKAEQRSPGHGVLLPYILAFSFLLCFCSSIFAIAERWTSSGPSAKRRVRVRAYLGKKQTGIVEIVKEEHDVLLC